MQSYVSIHIREYASLRRDEPVCPIPPPPYHTERTFLPDIHRETTSRCASRLKRSCWLHYL
ncbi:hypothetical protein ARMSODRAFT_321901 [Armillaria solidipes]|uniref:Uncharacterized protein n=1 Tax=Armillaria solidipes TaxID=1076256 RepID=A0A2H3B8H5_9AGAR|nr:hypothetical protein ARMSODRAFT_321901 [Armillaria solidipes]